MYNVLARKKHDSSDFSLLTIRDNNIISWIRFLNYCQIFKFVFQAGAKLNFDEKIWLGSRNKDKIIRGTVIISSIFKNF